MLSQLDAPHKHADLYYKFCPTLMYFLPKETVDMLIAVDKAGASVRSVATVSSLVNQSFCARFVGSASGSVQADPGADALRRQRGGARGRRQEGGPTRASRQQAGAERGQIVRRRRFLRFVAAVFELRVDSPLPRTEPNHAIRYLEHCIRNRNKDPAVHNYLISLYVKQSTEDKLLRFIEVRSRLVSQRLSLVIA